jgi:hypothetical protein
MITAPIIGDHQPRKIIKQKKPKNTTPLDQFKNLKEKP